MNQTDTPRPSTQQPKRQRGPHFAIRQVLNIAFMLLAVIGVVIYLTGDKTVGTIIVLIAMVFKMAECVLRMIAPRKRA